MKTPTTLVTIAALAIGIVALPAAHADNGSSKKSAKSSLTKKAKKAKAARTSASGKKTKNFDFMADDITADRIRPDGTAIFGRQSVDHKSLIRLRTEFIAEIVKSAEML